MLGNDRRLLRNAGVSLPPRIRLGLAALLALGLAFLLRDAIEHLVLIPLAYLGWGFGLLYRSVPQAVIWAVLAILVFFALVDSFLPTRLPPAGRDVPARPLAGPIKALAGGLGTRSGHYQKWLMANRLGAIAQRILLQRNGGKVASSSVALPTGDWDPPVAVAAYFDAGLNGSFADFPRSRRLWSRPTATPLDLPAEHALEFLEAQFKEPA